MLVEEVHKLIGEWVADGWSTQEILEVLEDTKDLPAEPMACLRGVYDVWRNQSTDLSLNREDLVNWHVIMRQRVLRDALKTGLAGDGRLALSVLDSLASLQGIGGTTIVLETPLSINLIPKPLETETEDNK